MSGISGTSGTTSTGTGTATTSSASTLGNNVAPISFAGIASGVDYNSIITKLTSLTLAPNTLYQNQITQLNAKNAEIIKINTLLASVQSSLTALSDPATFAAYSGTSSDTADAFTSQIAGQPAVPGAYTVEATHLATATGIVSGPTGTTIDPNLPLACVNAAITPTNGSAGGNGIFTIDGVSVHYDVASQSLSSIVANIYAAVSAVDAGFSIAVTAGGLVSLSSTDQQLSIGSAADKGNLEAVLKLDVAAINNSGPPYTAQSAGPIGGINVGTPLNAADGAGFPTPVSAGSFTINGVSFAVDPVNDNVASILQKINASTAGVTALYDATTGTFSLANKTTGAQGIVVGSSGDTSNFLALAGLTPAAGATTTIGDQAYVTVKSISGALHTVYSSSNAVAGAIPGLAVNVTGDTDTPFTIDVALNTQPAISAINQFVSVFNAAVNEISLATAPPIVQQTKSSSTTTTSTSSVVAAGGILYGDPTVQSLQYRLTQLVQGVTNSGSASYNSLDSIGLSLDSQHTVYQANTNAYGGQVSQTATGPIATSTADGTDGALLPLDITKFTAAFEADPSAVAALFTSTASNSVTAASATAHTSSLSYQLGSYLTGVTGFPTALVSGLVGTVPITSLLQSDENSFSAEITALNASIKLITDKANAQADQLRAEANASEALISKYQSEQSAVSQIGGSSNSSG